MTVLGISQTRQENNDHFFPPVFVVCWNPEGHYDEHTVGFSLFSNTTI